ncbi:MAG: nucleotidyl transferase AbiEii/AbiGii toxin family protein [Rectinemataceae bacterium]
MTAANRLVKVKLETDTDPPRGINTEMKTLLEPFPVSIRVVTPSGLFAGKLHACLCRSWKTRVKGRDWYDLLFFVATGTAVDLPHLEARLRQSGHWEGEVEFGPDEFLKLLEERISTVDWRQAQEDVLPFVRDPRPVESWTADLFRDVATRLFKPVQGPQ